jgi:hypothetical protein
MWEPLSVTINFGHERFFFHISYNSEKDKVTFVILQKQMSE